MFSYLILKKYLVYPREISYNILPKNILSYLTLKKYHIILYLDSL